MRFIDLSTDGGCSKKAHAKDLRAMLEVVAVETGSTDVAEIANDFTDTGSYQMESETLVSTVDIVLPFIDDPALFGEISALHALNDIYASLAIPLGALLILGIPNQLSPTSQEVIKSLSAAVNTLKNNNVKILGGHSLAHQQDFFLGLSIFGKSIKSQATETVCGPGDSIILTKRIGTSVASLRWRLFNSPTASHADVIDGMRQSNESTAKILSACGIKYCTDVSGFGLINNLHNLLRRGNYAAVIKLEAVPVYDSVAEFIEEDELCTRQYYHNAENIRFLDENLSERIKSKKIAWLDSQVSGGLIFICPAQIVHEIQTKLNQIDIESTVIGNLIHGKSGNIQVADN